MSSIEKDKRKQIQQCYMWIEAAADDAMTKSYGKNRETVLTARDYYSGKAGEIQNLQAEVQALGPIKENNPEDTVIAFVKAAYNSLKAYSNKSVGSVEYLAQVSELGELGKRMSEALDDRLPELARAARDDRQLSEKSAGGASPTEAEPRLLAMQSYVKSMKSLEFNWSYMSTVVDCLHVQVQDAGEYNRFFHEVAQCREWISAAQASLRQVFDHQNMQGNGMEAIGLIADMHAMLTGFLQWQACIERLMRQSLRLTPMAKRSMPVKEKYGLHASSLAQYQNDEISIVAGEELMVVDNFTNRQLWKVRKTDGTDEVGSVPAVLIQLLPGDREAMLQSIKLRNQLVATWKSCAKLLGKKMVAYMLKVFRDWQSEEMEAFGGLDQRQQRSINRMMKQINTTLSDSCSELKHPSYAELQEKIDRLTFILSEANGDQGSGEDNKKFVVAVGTVDELLKKYSDFLIFLNAYAETSASDDSRNLIGFPEENQMTNEHLPTVQSTAYINRYMTGELTEDGPLKKGEEEYVLKEGLTFKVQQKDVEEMEAEEIVAHEHEEQKRYVITAVVDLATDEDISLDDAVARGIVNQQEGTYLDTKSGEKLTIGEAMNEGLIMMELVSEKKTKEKKKTVGLLTIRTTKTTGDVSVKAVLDADGKEVPLANAIKTGLLDATKGVYIDAATKKEIPIAQAAQKGLVILHEKAAGAKPDETQVETKTYAVYAVVDQEIKDRISFQEAIDKGILDTEQGLYVHSDTKERIPIPDAIARGFMKAKPVTDTEASTMDISQRVTVEKFNTVKKKLKTMMAMGAFSKMKKNPLLAAAAKAKQQQ